MRKRIITLFIILLVFQAIQVATVSYSIRQLQSAVSQVTVTVEGREVSRSTNYLMDQLRDDVVLIAGMNFPVTGLKKLKSSWNAFTQKLNSMYDLAHKLSFEPELLSQLRQNVNLSAQKKNTFEKTILADSPAGTYTDRVHEAAFELDEALENTNEILEVLLNKFVREEATAVLHEHKIHNLPVQVVSTIGFVIGGILIATGIFAVTKIVNPLIDLTIKYKIAMKKLKKEQEIAIALEKARATAQAKSDFLANMSHELRTPMNAILGFSQLLDESELDGKQKSYLELIMSSGKHLIQIINDILDFSKLEAGKINLELLDFNLEKMINEVMKIATTRMAENPLDTYIDYPEDMPKHIHSDPTRLKQILVNLISNAIKFTHQGEVGIIARVDKQIAHQKDEIPLRISVKDSGIGIPKEKIDNIFASFTQVDESTTRKYGGTGLGLTITKSIVEAMGGRIWVESEEGKGSEFIFTMKVKEGKAVDHWEPDKSAKKLLEGKRVFIIDDNEISRKVVNKNCESLDMEVLSMADSGPTAFAKLDEFAQKDIFPDIILCDVMMSDMYGYEIAPKVRSKKKFDHVKIIAVTKMSEADVSHYIRDDCFDAYLIKPVSQIDMINVLSKALGYEKPGEKEPDKAQTLAIENKANFKGIRILVAENNIANFMLLREFLENLKCDANYTYNGEEAIQQLESREYDLCLMDLQMPVLSGIEATKIIREKISKDLPIIALTAAVLKEDREKAKEAGMTDFLDKPVDMQKLKEKILQYGRPSKIQTETPQEGATKLRTLVVDDNLLNMKLLVAFLKKLGYENDSAFNGQEAVEKARANKYDICFMDIQMPVMGGVEATKIIRDEISKEMPIIAVTAVKDFTLEKSLEAGMNDCLQKPVDLPTLKKVISKYCNIPS